MLREIALLIAVTLALRVFLGENVGRARGLVYFFKGELRVEEPRVNFGIFEVETHNEYFSRSVARSLRFGRLHAAKELHTGNSDEMRTVTPRNKNRQIGSKEWLGNT